MKLRLTKLILAAACAATWATAAGAATAADAAAAAAAAVTATPTPARIAVVNGKDVSRDEYERALAVIVRNRFYHRAPPEGQIEEVRREVAEGLVNRTLILVAAQARDIAVDEAAIRATIDGFEARYAGSPNWPQIRDTRLPAIKRELAEQQQLAALEASVRAIADPAPEAVRVFYEANPALFTEPERVHVSVILLKVDPSAGKVVRDKAREEGRELHARLAKGDDFAAVAKVHSADSSAEKGGDLGYLHRGMLAANLHEHLDALVPGAVSEPVDVLEGVALFKLHARTKPELRAFDVVKPRAQELLKREQSDKAWKDFVAGLRRAAVVEMDPSWLASVARPQN